jgi:diguanylate cyclase (GGDEF)-like protein
VTVPVPVDTTLLARIGRGLTPGDRLVALKSGVVVAGEGRGERVALTPGAPAHVRVANASYRALATSPLTEPRGVELAALAPQSTIDTAAGAAERRVAGALAAALLLFGLATYLLGRSIVRSLKNLAHAADEIAGGRLGQRVETRGHDEFAQVGRAFNRMAAQLELRLSELETERTHVQHSVARFGEALAATHDPTQLVRIVVESAVEATGALGGMVVGPNGELVRTGDLAAGEQRIALPLRVGASDFGMLVLHGTSFDAAQIETATSLAAQVVIALENARLHRIVERQALADSLTGLANRRSLEETLRAEVARSGRFGDSLTVVFADLDDFKQINDAYGHAAGDEVLKEFAKALRATVRESDVAGRWGGEEFALVLTGTDAEGGVRLAERARAAIASRTVVLPGGEEVSVTASFGVASFPDHREPGELLAAADAALYEAKRTGKNKVVRAFESSPEEMV